MRGRKLSSSIWDVAPGEPDLDCGGKFVYQFDPSPEGGAQQAIDGAAFFFVEAFIEDCSHEAVAVCPGQGAGFADGNGDFVDGAGEEFDG
jgi:hypothetical protein